MKKLKMFIALFTITILITSCDDKEKLGKVVFKNRSVNNHTYNVVWDGTVISSIYPQMDSDTFDVNSGPHTLVFRIANTHVAACDKGSPSINEDYIHTFICSY